MGKTEIDSYDVTSHSGKLIRKYRDEQCLTQDQLAKKSFLSQSDISFMERDLMKIRKKHAKKLAKAFDVDYQIFM